MLAWVVLTWAMIHRPLPNVIISQKRASPQTGSISSCSSASVSSVCPLSLELIRAHHLSCTLSKALRLQPPPTSSPQPDQEVTHSVSHHMPMLPDYPLLSLMLHNTRMALSLSTYMRQVRNTALKKAQILRGCEASLQPVILTLFFFSLILLRLMFCAGGMFVLSRLPNMDWRKVFATQLDVGLCKRAMHLG